MKLTINGFEIDIKARHTEINKRMNAEDTKWILNTIAMIAYDAASDRRHNGYNAIAEEAVEIATDIHDYLESLKYFEE